MAISADFLQNPSVKTLIQSKKKRNAFTKTSFYSITTHIAALNCHFYKLTVTGSPA